MVALSRRSFLASSVAVAAHPALAIPASSSFDVIIIGAGAAGIAAARRIVAAPPSQRLRLGRPHDDPQQRPLRYARDGEMEDFLANLVRCNRAIDSAARGKTDVSCAQVLPKDLGDWRATMEFVLGPFGCGKDLDEVSAMDLARSAERDVNASCREGVGTLLAKLAAGLDRKST